MKRTLLAIFVVGIVAVVTYLSVMKHLAEQRAARLDAARQEADARIIQLEADLQVARQQVAELAKVQQRVALKVEDTTASASPGQAKTVTAPAPTAATLTGSKLLYTATSAAGLTNLVRIEGTSTIHNWQVESRLIGGTVEFPPEFLAGLRTQPCPTNLDIKGAVFIPVRSLKSYKADGSLYSDAMDEIMYGKLLAEQFKRITFTLDSCTINSGDANAAMVLQATGSLGLAGVTNTISMPVYVSPGAEGRIQFSGLTRTRMTDFKIAPPEPKGTGIKTGDEVTLKFSWWVKPAAVPAK